MDQPNLTDRQRRFLIAAFEAEPKPDDYFDFRPVGEKAGFTYPETTDLVTKLKHLGLINVVSHFRLSLKPSAREYVREYVYAADQEVQRKLSPSARRLVLFLVEISKPHGAARRVDRKAFPTPVGFSEQEVDAALRELQELKLLTFNRHEIFFEAPMMRLAEVLRNGSAPAVPAMLPAWPLQRDNLPVLQNVMCDGLLLRVPLHRAELTSPRLV